MSDQSSQSRKDPSRTEPRVRDVLDPVEGSGGGISARQVVGIVLAVAAILFILQNRQDVTITMVAFDLTASLWLVTSLLLGIGILIGLLLSSRRSSRKG